jgi:hypothetical protein
MTLRTRLASIVFGAVVPLACGNESSGGPPGTGGQSSSGGSGGSGATGGGGPDCTPIEQKTVGQLTLTELGLFCDCSAAFFGGYSKVKTCSDGKVVASAPSHAECVDGFEATYTQCQVLVKDALSCLDALASCEDTSLLCASLEACEL